MFTMTGYRPYTVQTVALGADEQGKLTAIRHEATGQTSPYEEYTETVLNPTRFLYACPNPHVNPLGAKGIAELALVGVAPAVANAGYHATGKRVRELPITLDKLFQER